MHQLENKLNEWLNTKAPFHLPVSAKEGLVKALPWLALIVGAFMLYGAYWTYQAASYVNDLSYTLNQLSVAFGQAPVASPLNSAMLWLTLALLVAEAVMMFMAYSGLKEKQKRGWNLLFWASLLSLVVGLAQLFAYGFGGLLSYLLGSAVGLYLLFQVRSYYNGAAMPVPKEEPKETPGGDSAPKPPAES